jgi:hypothetical protein
MSSFKRINPADQFQDTIVANKRWTGTYSSYPYIDNYITIYTGQKITGSFDINGLISQSVYYKLEYDTINQLFYQNYTTTLDTQQRIAYSLNYDSASIGRATSSYFVYNENPLFVDNFPTGANQTIRTIYIDKDAYGNQILPGSTIISSSAFVLVDDGNGNLWDYKNSVTNNFNWSSWTNIWSSLLNNWPSYTNSTTPPVHVGNVFYAFGLYIITNQDYQNYFPGFYYGSTVWNTWNTNWNGTNQLWNVSQGGGTGIINSVSASNNVPIYFSFQNEYPIYENYIYAKTKAGEFNLSYNPTLCPGTGSAVADFATGSLATGSYFTPYATTIGLYNNDNQLLMVAKLGQPIPISAVDDMTFVIRYDT